MAASDILFYTMLREYLLSEILALYPVELSSGSVPVREGFEPPTSRLKGEVSDNRCIATIKCFHILRISTIVLNQTNWL